MERRVAVARHSPKSVLPHPWTRPLPHLLLVCVCVRVCVCVCVRERERERERERNRVLCVLEEWFVLCRCPSQRSSVHVLACRTERGADRLKTGTNQSPYWCARAQVPDPHLSSTSRCQRQCPTGAEVKRTGIAPRPFCSAVCSSIKARNNHATL